MMLRGVSRRSFLKGSAAAAALGLAAPGCLLDGENGPGLAKRPNIVMLVSDELAPEYLGCYGGEIPTPNLDRLCRGGTRFTEAYCTSSVCAPSRFTLMTGKYALRATNFADSPEPVTLGWGPSIEGQPTIFGELKRAGYRTGFVGKWGVSLGYRLDLPVVTIDDDLDAPETDAKLRRRQRIWAETLKKEIGMDYVASVGGNFGRKDGFGHHHMEWMTQGAVDFLDEAAGRDEPFFLYCATTAVHGPEHVKDLDFDPRYTPGGKRSEPFTCHPPRATIRTRLEQAGLPLTSETVGVTFLDDHVGAVLDKLRDLDRERHTLVVFLPDHNVEPGKATCYEQGVHVPMLVRWPAAVRAGRETDRRVSFVDLMPTLLDAAGASAPEGVDGVSFLPALKGRRQEPRKPLYFEIGRTRAIRKGRFKYIAFRPADEAIAKMRAGEVDVAYDQMNSTRQMHSQIAMQYFPHYFDGDQLYDLQADPYEQRNLANLPGYGVKLNELRGELAGVLRTFPHPFSLDVNPFLATSAYRELAQARRARPAPGWWVSKGVTYPPEPAE